jgi:hypothetical protein
MEQRWTRARRNGLILVLLSGAFSLFWGIVLSRTVPGGVLDLQGLYYGSQCLLHHCDPYNVQELEQFYRTQGVEDPTDSVQRRQVKVLYVNLPTTFLFVAPLANLPWKLASVLWMGLIAGVYLFAAILMWDVGADYSPGLSTWLVCILLVNSEVVFATGNTAGLVISLSVIGAWCFLRQRFVPIGILCFAAALAIKPHDSGLVWLFFVLAGYPYRKWALRSFAITAVLGVIAFVWVSHAAPHWTSEIRANLATISGPHGLNEPGPNAVTGASAAMVLDLQAAVSVFWDDPAIYNSVSYLVCGTMLLLWLVKALRSKIFDSMGWLALAAVVPLTILVTYHRPYDTKLLLLSVPACAILCSRGGAKAKLAVLVSTAAVTLTGDVPLAMLIVIYKGLKGPATGAVHLISTVVLTQPASLTLLAAAVFYVWVYVKSDPAATASLSPGESTMRVSGATSAP